MLCIQANVYVRTDVNQASWSYKMQNYCKDLCLNNIAKLSPSKASASAEISSIFDSPHPHPTRESTKTQFSSYICIPQWKTTSMENDLNGRRPQRKMTSMEDVLNGRLPQWKTTLMEDYLNERQPQWKTISMENNLNGRQPQ